MDRKNAFLFGFGSLDKNYEHFELFLYNSIDVSLSTYENPTSISEILECYISVMENFQNPDYQYQPNEAGILMLDTSL